MCTIYSLTDTINSSLDYPLFKYMDFPKFMSLITTKTLHFTRIDNFDEYFKENEPGKVLKALERVTGGAYNLPDFFEESKKYCISCWTQTPIESYPLWEAYGGSNYSLAIKSSVSKIKDSISDLTTASLNGIIANNIKCGKINYFDDSMNPPPDHNYSFFFHKPCQFEAEKEYRFLINGDRLPAFNNIAKYLENPKNLTTSIDIPIEPKKLIKQIYVSYHASEWFYQLIKSIVIKYELVEKDIDKFVTWSALK